MQGLRVRGVQCGADYDTRRNRPPRAFGEDTDKAAYLHGDRVGRRMALHYRVSAPGLLERSPRDSVVAVLPWSPLQLPGALIRRTPARNKPGEHSARRDSDFTWEVCAGNFAPGISSLAEPSNKKPSVSAPKAWDS